MVIIGMGMVFAGYWVTMWGYCLVRGYNQPFTAMAGFTWAGAPPGKDKTAKAPATGPTGVPLGA